MAKTTKRALAADGELHDPLPLHNAPETIYCIHCGGANHPSARFCRSCGDELATQEVEAELHYPLRGAAKGKTDKAKTPDTVKIRQPLTPPEMFMEIVILLVVIGAFCSLPKRNRHGWRLR